MTGNGVTSGTFGFLCGMCEVEELPGTFVTGILTALGMTPSGARSYLNRGTARGNLVGRRTGRHTSYAMSGKYLERFHMIARSFDEQPVWEGGFHTVIYDVPESRRGQRDALRASAFAQRWGCPRPGVLIGITSPGAWATGSLIGWLEVDLDTARKLVALSWPLTQCAQDVVETDAEISRIINSHPAAGNNFATTPEELAAASDQLLINDIVLAHRAFNQAILLRSRLPEVPQNLFPSDFPYEALERINALTNGAFMTKACAGAGELLSRHLGKK